MCSFENDLIFAAVFTRVELDAFRSGGRHVLADEIRFDRQFAMAAIDQDGQLNWLGAAEIIQASIAARMVRPLNRTSSTSTTVLPVDIEGNDGGLDVGAAR